MAAATLSHHFSKYDGPDSEVGVAHTPRFVDGARNSIIASKTSGYKYHTFGRANTIKDKEVLRSGQLVGYKETSGVREWCAINTSGTTDAEKEPQGIFVATVNQFHQRDKSKHLLTGVTTIWWIITGGAYINLSRIYISNLKLALESQHLFDVGKADNKGTELSWTISTDNIDTLQQLETNTSLRVQNDVPYVSGFVNGFLLPTTQAASQ